MLFDDLPDVSSAAKVKKANENQIQKPASSLFDDLPSPSMELPSQGTEDASKSKISHHAETAMEEESQKPLSMTETIENKGPSLDFLPVTLRKRKKTTKPTPLQHRMVVTESDTIVNIHEDSGAVSQQLQQIYEESKDLTDRHASILPADIYIPSIPNDYLAYKQRRENDMMKTDLEIQAKKTKEMQAKLRLQIQEEKQKAMNEAIESGNYDEVIQNRLSSFSKDGMGRGRGVNNLPAWLLKKQQEKEQDRLRMS